MAFILLLRHREGEPLIVNREVCGKCGMRDF